jgi:hypothetical protein
MKVKLENVRLAYFNGYVAKEFTPGDGKPRYGSNFIFAKTHPAYKRCNEAMEFTAGELWKQKAPFILKAIRSTGDVCLRDGDLSTSDGFAGNFYIAAYSNIKSRPLILGPDTDPETGKLRILTEESGKPYSGCYVNATVDIYAYSEVKNQINAKLLAVQFLKDGEPFTKGERGVFEDFDDLASGADAEDTI